eukprot:4526591-Prorocentrum_lima.AAC.1
MDPAAAARTSRELHTCTCLWACTLRDNMLLWTRALHTNILLSPCIGVLNLENEIHCTAAKRAT